VVGAKVLVAIQWEYYFHIHDVMEIAVDLVVCDFVMCSGKECYKQAVDLEPGEEVHNYFVLSKMSEKAVRCDSGHSPQLSCCLDVSCRRSKRRYHRIDSL
jgi:hypothetical protein